ncbi:MAG: HEAT repeat domain-containing protein [Planctomycetales bacterium]
MSDVPPPNRKRLPEELPPVEPPSAKFIVQLFLVPGVIVMGIVMVWLLINKLASTEQDWRALVRGIENTNEHERWRSAFGLAQLLQADQSAAPGEVKLVNNTEVAGKLAEMLHKELQQPAKGDNSVDQRAFLARTLGMFQTPETVLPTLGEALASSQDREVRKNALGAIAVVAGRELEKGSPLKTSKTLDQVIEISAESDPLFKQMGAYTLGLFDDPAATKRLGTLMNDDDRNTRANAVAALVRKGDMSALPAVETLLTSVQQTSADSKEPHADFLVAKNMIEALSRLAPKLSAAQKGEVIKIVEPVATKHADTRIRLDAEKLLITLKK